jgi:putative drug exporter of the RND superfamily
MARLGHFLYRHRRSVLIGTLVIVIVAGVFGGNVAKHLKAGGFDAPDVESTRAADILGKDFHQSPPNFLLLIEAKKGTVDSAAVKAAGIAVTNELSAEDGVGQVLGAWALGAKSPLFSTDRTKAIIAAEILGNDEEAGNRAKAFTPKYTRSNDVIRVRVGGFQALFAEVSEKIEKDLQGAESMAIPLTLILLIVVFASLVAAVLPVSVGIVSILGTFLVLRLIALTTDVSVFALSMVTAMGLGLAIDYSLFIVSRFREELRKGADVESAIVTTVQTAGRTIVFSGFTVAVSLAALLVFPLYFFKSFGYAGIGVVLTAVLGAVVFLPAALSVIGPRVDWAPRLVRPRRWYAVAPWFGVWPVLWATKRLAEWQRRHHKDVGEGFWHRLAVLVMKRPIPVATGVVVLLLLLGTPFLHVNLGLPDERVLPPGAATRDVQDTIRASFSSEEVNSTRVVAPDFGNPVERREAIAAFARDLSKLPGVAHVDSLAGQHTNGQITAGAGVFSARFVASDATWFNVILSGDPYARQGEELVATIRDARTPFPVLVGGASAFLVDAKHALLGKLPLAIAIIGIATFLLLFAAFGSLLVPLKALVLNFLSLSATFGAMVWIFQDGHLSGVLGFTPSPYLDISSPVLMFCIAFGLSMDYEVFLLSRIKEEYDRTGDNERSVALGLERTGRIVTAAAVLISVVFLAMGTSSVRFIKLFGIGMTLAVLMDAFVIRGTLVPAFMRLAGRANWWLPDFLKAIHAKIEIREVHDVAPAHVEEAAPVAPPSKPKPKPRKPAPKKAPARKPAPVRTTTATRKTTVRKTTVRKTTAKRKATTARKPAAKKPAPRRKAIR